MIFVGDDWAEDHHDIVVLDEGGKILARRRLPEGVAGIGALHELVAAHADDPALVAVGIETDRGLWVAALVAAGYQTYAVNPLSVARYRERHATSGAKSDQGDAATLADLVRTDRHHHRPVAGDSARSPGGQGAGPGPSTADLGPSSPGQPVPFGAAGVLPRRPRRFRHRSRPPRRSGRVGPGPHAHRRRPPVDLGHLVGPAPGRPTRHIPARAAEIQTGLRAPQMRAPGAVEAAYGAQVAAAVAIIAEMTRQIARPRGGAEPRVLSRTRTPRSCVASQGSVWSSAPGCWASSVTTRTAMPMVRHDATTPAPRRSPSASGKKRAVLARFVRNRHLADACSAPRGALTYPP